MECNICIEDLLDDENSWTNLLNGETYSIKYVKSKNYDPVFKRDVGLSSISNRHRWCNDGIELVEVKDFNEATAMIVFFENSEESIEEVLKIILDRIKSSAYKQSRRLESMLDILVEQFGSIAFNLDFSRFFDKLTANEIILAKNYVSYGRDVSAILIEI